MRQFTFGLPNPTEGVYLWRSSDAGPLHFVSVTWTQRDGYLAKIKNSEPTRLEAVGGQFCGPLTSADASDFISREMLWSWRDTAAVVDTYASAAMSALLSRGQPQEWTHDVWMRWVVDESYALTLVMLRNRKEFFEKNRSPS